MFDNAPPAKEVRRRPERPASATATLSRAVEVATSAAPHLRRLAEFLFDPESHFPLRPLASNTLHGPSAWSGEHALEEAIASCQWWSLNTPEYGNAIAADCDSPDWRDRLEDLVEHYGLPQPTYVVSDPWKGTAHLVWLLRAPVWIGGGERSLPKPKAMFHAVQRGITEVLGADRGFTNRLTKNPYARSRPLTRSGGPAFPPIWEIHIQTCPELRWHTEVGPLRGVDLLAMRAALKRFEEDTGVDPTVKRPRTAEDRAAAAGNAAAEASGKGTKLWDALRHRAYAARESRLHVLERWVEELAVQLASPASARDRVGMARRVSGFMARRWRGKIRNEDAGGAHCARGAMGLGHKSELPEAEKQALAGKRTGELRAAKRNRRLAEAEARLSAQGKAVSKASLAAEAGVGERTVARWRAEGMPGRAVMPLTDALASDTPNPPVPAPKLEPEPVRLPAPQAPTPKASTRRKPATEIARLEKELTRFRTIKKGVVGPPPEEPDLDDDSEEWLRARRLWADCLAARADARQRVESARRKAAVARAQRPVSDAGKLVLLRKAQELDELAEDPDVGAAAMRKARWLRERASA